ncbi:MAG: hypothetical protein PHQ00_05485, partial [Phycisphaerae bacterium]|nr:hypothetical protein [Phycisphaerae bacterium]
MLWRDDDLWMDDNGNRSGLDYYLNGSLNGSKTSVNYTYNYDNMLTGFTTAGGPMFTLENTVIDGLGRLKSAAETLTKPNNSTVAHTLGFSYDSLSQLKDALISDVLDDGEGGYEPWEGIYDYERNGDMTDRLVTYEGQVDFRHIDGEMVCINGYECTNIFYDLNGNMTACPKSEGPALMSLEYNWDNKLRSAIVDSDSISLKYDPA